eukprot:scaffold2858_cov659-Pavlova_lutheri.AAC.178
MEFSRDVDVSSLRSIGNERPMRMLASQYANSGSRVQCRGLSYGDGRGTRRRRADRGHVPHAACQGRRHGSVAVTSDPPMRTMTLPLGR